MRELALPPDMTGVSLPYRPDFIHELSKIKASVPKFNTIICLKIDKLETKDNKSIYIPLRTGQGTALDTASGESLIQFHYIAGYTPDYTNKDCLAYSAKIFEAVGEATDCDDAGDEALVTFVSLKAAELGAVGEKKESDRWVRLTRALTDDGERVENPVTTLLKKLNETAREKYVQNYKQLLFIRLAGILSNGGQKRLKLCQHAYKLSVNEQYEVEVLSSLLPNSNYNNMMNRWHLEGSTKHFDFLSWSIEIGQGIARHRLPLHPRQASKPQTLRLSPTKSSPSDDVLEPHQFDVSLLVRSRYTVPFLGFVFLVLLTLAVGVVLASGIIDQELARDAQVPEKWTQAVGNWASAVGAGLLILGSLGTYYLTQGRSG